jgi:hypothetical protein
MVALAAVPPEPGPGAVAPEPDPPK